MNLLDRLRSCHALEARVKELEEKSEVLEKGTLDLAGVITRVVDRQVTTEKTLNEHLNAEKAAIEASIAEIEGYW